MKNVVLVFEHGSQPEAYLAEILKNALSEAGLQVHVDRRVKISVDWARSIDEKIRSADAVLVVLSGRSPGGEMLNYEMEIACDAKLKRREMRIVLVAVGDMSAARSIAGRVLGDPLTTGWENEEDTPLVIAETLDYLIRIDVGIPSMGASGIGGGAVNADSPFYIERPADFHLAAYMEACEPTILVQGARQTGKTSLIGNGLRIVRQARYRACLTDFQSLGSSLNLGEGEFYRQLAERLARQMADDYDLKWDWSWEDLYGPTSNLDEFVRSMVAARADRLIWFMDEVDCLFSSGFADSFFALVRSWHNLRSLKPQSVWARFSVVITYATEAHLFIPDINQSPFNVGRKVELGGFTLRQMEDLNGRYGEPLRGIDQVMVLHDLLDGQPYLSRIAFDYLVRTSGDLRGLVACADRNDGPFGDHLRRVLVSVTQIVGVRDAVARVLANEFVGASPDVYRLVSSGILAPNSVGNHQFRCKLYRRYLSRYLL